MTAHSPSPPTSVTVVKVLIVLLRSENSSDILSYADKRNLNLCHSFKTF